MKKSQRKIATSFRLSRDSYDLMYALSERMGITRGAIVELALRTLDQFYRGQISLPEIESRKAK